MASTTTVSHSQLGLEWATPARTRPLRPIHYLGSKLRLVDEIADTMAEVAPFGSRVCDLFAGSGVVSQQLAGTYQVVSVDVQEFSRVLCAATVSPPANREGIAQRVLDDASNGSLRTWLRCALADLLALENVALAAAREGDPAPLADLMDLGAIASASNPSMLVKSAEALAEPTSDGARESVVTRMFGGSYFSWAQSIDLDALLAAAHRLPQAERDFALAAILATASEIVNSIGKHFAQPVRLRAADGTIKRQLVRQCLRDRSESVFDLFTRWAGRLADLPGRGPGHLAICADYRQVLSDQGERLDAVYADPPYTRDHYSRFYHVLETMTRRDLPQVSSTLIRTGGQLAPSRGVYREDRHQSDFSIRSRAPGAFSALFEGVRRRGIPLVLSYSPFDPRGHPRMLTMEELTALASRYFASVDVRDVSGIVHNKLNASARHLPVAPVAEVLVVCRP